MMVGIVFVVVVGVLGVVVGFDFVCVGVDEVGRMGSELCLRVSR